MSYSQFKLISHHLCPYVQRSTITLREKEISFERVDIDLANPPVWFKRISPTGKVPLLIVKNTHILFESAVICEYLDEVTPGSLHPADVLEKARHRSWIEFGTLILNDIAGLYRANDGVEFNRYLIILRDRFEILEAELKEGGYFSGDKFNLVDAVYGPIFRYFEVFDGYLPKVLFERLPKVERWQNGLSQRQSNQMAVREDYPELLKRFVQGLNSHLGQLMSN